MRTVVYHAPKTGIEFNYVGSKYHLLEEEDLTASRGKETLDKIRLDLESGLIDGVMVDSLVKYNEWLRLLLNTDNFPQHRIRPVRVLSYGSRPAVEFLDGVDHFQDPEIGPLDQNPYNREVRLLAKEYPVYPINSLIPRRFAELEMRHVLSILGSNGEFVSSRFPDYTPLTNYKTGERSVHFYYS